MQTLTVVNEMLGTMGETPLNTLEDPHTYRGACLSTLDRVNREVQAKGWVFNREFLTLQPGALNGHIYLPGDFIAVRVQRKRSGAATRTIVQRGRRLYDTGSYGSEGTYVFTESVDVELVRLVPFEDLPESPAAHIAAVSVVEFQSKYDGDVAKTRELVARISGPMGTLAALQSEETRATQVNMIESNPRLMRLRRIIGAARRYI